MQTAVEKKVYGLRSEVGGRAYISWLNWKHDCYRVEGPKLNNFKWLFWTCLDIVLADM